MEPISSHVRLSEHTILSKHQPNKDRIRRKSAHANRNHVHDEDARVAVKACVFVVVASVSVAGCPSKSGLNSRPLEHPESEIASEWGHRTL